MSSGTIPVFVGITGHIYLHEEDRAALRAAVKAALEDVQAQCPHSEVKLLTSLAAGGDLLCADAAEELGMKVVAALPMEAGAFRQTFQEAEKTHFDHHLASAEMSFVVPPQEELPESLRSDKGKWPETQHTTKEKSSDALRSSPGNGRGTDNGAADGGRSSAAQAPPRKPVRDYLYRQAGIYVSGHCHVLLALWDGSRATEDGCGTAEAVDFMLRREYGGPASGYVLPDTEHGAVIHVYTPRGGRRERKAGDTSLLGSAEALAETLHRIDEFNSLAAECPGGHGLNFDETPRDPLLLTLSSVYRTANALSGRYARVYRRTLGLLAAASTTVTMAFLLYDEAQLIWMILVCGAMLGAAWLCRRYAVHSDCHRRYLDYRVLAEWTRVQAYLRYAGSGERVTEFLTWSQRMETQWVVGALNALTIGPAPDAAHDIRHCWVEEQRAYHHDAAARTTGSLTRSDGIVRAALVLSVIFYVAAVAFEGTYGGLALHLSGDTTATVPAFFRDTEMWRTVLKIVLGTISAATLFISNYYGKQSLPRVYSDHCKMEHFYACISDELVTHGQNPDILVLLAREELIENGNWVSYQRDNTPDFSL